MTADHTKFPQLQFDPETQKTMKPEEVTKACLGCHNQAALQFHQDHSLDLAGQGHRRQPGEVR